MTSGLSLAFLLRPPTATSVRWRLARRLVALVAIGLVYNPYGTTGFDLAGRFLRRNSDQVGAAVVGRLVGAGLVALGVAAVLGASVVAVLDAGSLGDRARTVASWPFVALGRNALVVYV